MVRWQRLTISSGPVRSRRPPPRPRLGWWTTRSVLRHIRVVSKRKLKERIMAAIDHFNQSPVVHTWSYKRDKAA
jgi:hypothetical protein